MLPGMGGGASLATVPQYIASLDSQTLTAGSVGIIGERFRGFSTARSIGSISDGTSNLYGGGAITELYHDEEFTSLRLKITGSTNSGWTNMLVYDSTGTTLIDSYSRASASFASNEWTWAAETVNPFGANGTVRQVYFT